MIGSNNFDLKYYLLLGKVRYAISKTYCTDNEGNVDKSRYRFFRREFSETGFILYSLSIEFDGEIFSEYRFSYDANYRNVVQEFGKMGTPRQMKYLYKLDDKGRIKEKKLVVGDNCIRREVWFYDDHKLTESSLHYDSKGKIEKKIIGSYNIFGRMTDLQITDNKDDIMIYKMTYPETNTKITRITDKNNKIIKITTEIRNNFGYLLKYSESGATGRNSFSIKYENSYYLNDLLKEITCYREEGKIAHMYYFEYDLYKNPVVEKSLFPDTDSNNLIGRITENEYKYFD